MSDGIVGLAPTSKGSSIVESLYNDGLIGSKIFSFRMALWTDYSEESMFTLGGYDPEYFAPNDTLTWNPLVNTDYWTVELTSVSCENTIIPLTTNKVIIDTGTSFIVMPPYEFRALVNIWSNDLICAVD